MDSIDTKEIQKYEEDTKGFIAFGDSLKIESEDDYKVALETGKQFKDRLGVITKRKEEITKPLNAALKSVRDLFKPIETAGEEALSVIKTKMLAYTNEQTRKAEEAKAKLADRVERGTMKEETAVRKIDEIKTPEKTVKSESGSATTKVLKKYRVVDKSKIPLEFLEPDMTAIKASFKDGKPVDGVEEYEENTLAFT